MDSVQLVTGGDSSGEDSGKASGQAKLTERPSNKDAFLAIANKWKTIGTLLDLPSGKLDSIQAESHRDNDRMCEMIQLSGSRHWMLPGRISLQLDETRALQIKNIYWD